MDFGEKIAFLNSKINSFELELENLKKRMKGKKLLSIYLSIHTSTHLSILQCWDLNTGLYSYLVNTLPLSCTPAHALMIFILKCENPQLRYTQQTNNLCGLRVLLLPPWPYGNMSFTA